MLTAPSVAEIEGVTVWGDDADFFKFYLAGSHPRIRLDEAGDPVFLLVQYAISDEDREADPTLPDGAGYINFDVSFDVTDAEREAVREEMQARVDREWERRRNGTPEERNSRGVKGTTEPPTVEFAYPDYSRGSVSMFAPQTELLVSKQVAQGEPDLMSGNIAVFSMDLTAAGSEFMRQTLTQGEGSDLTPIQVGYKLFFPARIPPVNIEVTADSERIYEETRKFMDGEGVDHCTTYDFQQSDIDSNVAEISGLIDVKIDPGSATVSDEVLEELRQYALDMMQQLIETNFFTGDPGMAHYPGLEDDVPQELIEEERRRQRRDGNSKKYLKKSFDRTTMDLHLKLQQSSVIELQINPQATLQTFFEGLPPSEIERFVRILRLGNDLFRNLNLSVRVFADFEGTGLEAVEVELQYSGTDFDGSRKTHEETLVFTDTEPQTWSPSLIGSERTVRYRYRSKFTGGDFGPFTEFDSTESDALNIAIPSPGRLERKIVVGALDFDALELQSVQVDLFYEDDALGIDPVHETVILTRDQPEALLSREIGATVRNPMRYRRTFAFQSGEMLEDDDLQETASSTILINQPFGALMEVRLLPVGRGWEEVVQVTIELFYEDPDNDVDITEVAVIKTHQDLRVWTVRLRDREKTDFSYRVNISYKNGDHEESSLKQESGSGVVPISVREPRTTTVAVIPNRLDFEAAPICEVVLEHPASGARDTLTFHEAERQDWIVPIRPNETLEYTARVTHFPDDGDPVVIGPFEENDTALVLPPYKAPEAGTLEVRILPSLIDFEKTPLVVVDLLYEDDANNVSESFSIPFDPDTPAQTVAIPVKDVSRRLFKLTLTYFVAPDNQPVVSEPQFLTKNLVVVPPFRTDI
jgi:hypothetical protein